MKQSKWTIWEILSLTFGLTVCISFLTIIIAIVVYKEPTTEANKEIRSELINFLKYVTCTLFGIIYAKAVGNNKSGKP